MKAALDDSRGKSVVTVMPVMTKNNGGRQLAIPLEAGYDGSVFEVGALGSLLQPRALRDVAKYCR